MLPNWMRGGKGIHHGEKRKVVKSKINKKSRNFGQPSGTARSRARGTPIPQHPLSRSLFRPQFLSTRELSAQPPRASQYYGGNGTVKPHIGASRPENGT
jgi:hypothetical protein